MSSDMIEKIYKVSVMAGGIQEVVIFTDTFKIFGSLVNDDKNNMKHVLTLKNASVCKHTDECSCSIDSPMYEWLNIYEEKIAAFSILGYQSCAN